ncbi:MAG: xylose isomerase [Pedobacter sp.]|nr:MAG: xylose isomerase [Pedobacter sp.]
MKVNTGHLTYCTNIHAGKNWTEDFEALKLNFPVIKQEVSPDEPMGLGLRLSNEASVELANDASLTLFKNWLDETGAYVFTMNGFPYGEFHNTVVKEDVHTPDWTNESRRDYTIRLFHILKKLLPEGTQGGISTSPLSYRHWFKSEADLKEATEKATLHIIDVVKDLIHIYQTTGVVMHLDIEPEPDGILETGTEFIDWYESTFYDLAIPIIENSFNVSAKEAKTLLQQHLCLCYDVCHFAIGYEDHESVLVVLKSKGIKVGKIQISAALKAEMRRSSEEKTEVKKNFGTFNEPTYLHQVVAKRDEGSVIRYRDLTEALADFDNTEVSEWRAHFHVPISIKEIGLLESTQDDILKVLALQQAEPFTEHLEVETYTWEVLPQQLKLPITQSISSELNWVIDQLK